MTVQTSKLLCLPFSAPLTYFNIMTEVSSLNSAAITSQQEGIIIRPKTSWSTGDPMFPYNIVLAPGWGPNELDLLAASIKYDLIRASLRSGFFFYTDNDLAKLGEGDTINRPAGGGVSAPTILYHSIEGASTIKGIELFKKVFKEVIFYGDAYEKMYRIFENWDKLSAPAPAGTKKDASFITRRPFGEEAYNEPLANKLDFSNPVRINGRYNFYLQPYEDHTKKTSEQYLPNIYGLYESAKNESIEYFEQWALGQWSVWPTGGGWGMPIYPFNWHTDFNAYLNRIASTPVPLETEQKLRKYKTIGLSAGGINQYTEDIDIVKQKFPMYVDIQIPTNISAQAECKKIKDGWSCEEVSGGLIGDMLLKFNFFDIFMKAIMASYYPIYKNGDPPPSPPTTVVAEIKTDGRITKGECDSASLTGEIDQLFNERIAKLYLNELLKDEQGWFPSFAGTSFIINPGDPGYLIQKLLNPKVTNDIEEPVIFNMPEKIKNLDPFLVNALWASVKTKLLDIIGQKLRSVRDVYEGKLAYSEVLFYEIVKYSASPTQKNKFIQNIFIPNVAVGGSSVVEYIDTQVAFDQKYYYQIYAHTFVIGTEYTQFNKYARWTMESQKAGLFTITGPGGDQWMTDEEKAIGESFTQDAKSTNETKAVASFQYRYSPTVYMMRVPYYNTYVTAGNAVRKEPLISYDYEKLEKTLVFDKPPVFPDATVLPQYGEKNKILINTNFNVGEYLMEPILIDGDETANIDKIRLNQKRMEGPIIYSKDDFGGMIELLRIEKKPTSYKDYSPVSDTQVAILGGQGAFGFIDDTLEPDKTYYYIVRTKDVHGSYSNPSPVYEVRIVTSDGEKPYLVVAALFMDQLQKEEKTEISNMMKYIKIAPAFLQSYLDQADIIATYDSADEIDTKLIFGEPGKEKDVFDKKFKIRFTSKKTGRKFDLNITVKAPSIRERPNPPPRDTAKKAPVWVGEVGD